MLDRANPMSLRHRLGLGSHHRNWWVSTFAYGLMEMELIAKHCCEPNFQWHSFLVAEEPLTVH